MDSVRLDGLRNLMEPLNESQPRFYGCLYGDLGAGKTVLTAMIAHKLGGKWLYIDTAEEFTTLRINDRWRPLVTNMTRMTYDGLSQFEAIAEAIKGREPGFDFDGIIIDKSSQVSDRDLIRVTRTKQNLKSLVENDPDLPEWPHRNVAAVRFRDALDNLRKTRCHIIHVAGERYDKDKTNIEKVGPLFPRSIYNAIADPMQIVGHVVADIVPKQDQENYIRYVQIQPSIQVVAKSKIDKLGIKISFDDLVEGIGAFARGERSLVNNDTLVPINDDDSIPVY